PINDVILEVAAEVTDFEFKTLASYEESVKQPRELVVKRMQANSWWQDYPENRDAFIHNLADSKPLKTIEKELIALINREFGSQSVILGGNSIWNDRLFIRQWMPALDLKLHY